MFTALRKRARTAEFVAFEEAENTLNATHAELCQEFTRRSGGVQPPALNIPKPAVHVRAKPISFPEGAEKARKAHTSQLSKLISKWHSHFSTAGLCPNADRETRKRKEEEQQRMKAAIPQLEAAVANLRTAIAALPAPAAANASQQNPEVC